ncbi:hypothetical protein lerEdw1_003940, partial [Lerista edwardsae]
DIFLFTRTIDLKIRNGAPVAEDDFAQVVEFPHTVTDERGTNLSIVIDQKDHKLVLMAPKLGLEELSYEQDELQIKALPWLVGKVCGVCGKFDAETEQEYQTPTGYLAKDALSFALSWVAPSD